MNDFTGTLTTLFKMDSKRGKEIGAGFTPLCFEFNQFIDLPDKKKERLFPPIISTMKKLGRLSEATDRYLDLEKKNMGKLVDRHKNDKSSVQISHQDSSTELEGALDDVISNSKSALDAVVKILEPLWGIKLPTYGKAGKSVAKSLKRNVPQPNQPEVKRLIQLIEESEWWFTKLRDTRTRTEHWGETIVSPLSVTTIGGKIKKEYPIIDDEFNAAEFVEVVYKTLFCFLQDFIVLSLASRFVKGLAPVVANNEIGIKRKFAVSFEKEVRRQIKDKQ